MTSGLLRGLAERALGVETRLHSQRTVQTASAAHDEGTALESEVEAAGPTAVMQQAADEALARPVRSASASAAAQAAPEAVRVAEARPPFLAARPVIKATPGPGATSQTVDESVTRVDPSALRPPAPTAPVSLGVHDGPGIAPTNQGAALHAPALLMPLTPVAVPQARPAASPASRRELQARRQDANAPTEVHVSIGRVELTALAPAAPARAPTRRDHGDGRSLADYLRGSGSAGKRPA